MNTTILRLPAAIVPFVLAVACAPESAPPNPLAAPAVEALAVATRDGGDVAPLLSEDAIVIDGANRFAGKVDAAAALAGAGLTVTSQVDSHHDVLRALVTRGDDELVLFGQLDADGLLSFVVLTAPPGEGAGEGGDVVNAYQAAWNEGDLEKRTAQLEDSWAEDGRYVDPTADVTGREELVAHITGFRDSLPGAAVLGTSDVVEQAGMVHFRWVTTGLAGAVNIEGMDVGLVDDDGKLTLIAGFFGPFAPL